MPAYNNSAWAQKPINLEPDKLPAVNVTAPAPTASTPATAPVPSAFGPTEQQALHQLAQNTTPAPPPLTQQPQRGDDAELLDMIKQLLLRRRGVA